MSTTQHTVLTQTRHVRQWTCVSFSRKSKNKTITTCKISNTRQTLDTETILALVDKKSDECVTGGFSKLNSKTSTSRAVLLTLANRQSDKCVTCSVLTVALASHSDNQTARSDTNKTCASLYVRLVLTVTNKIAKRAQHTARSDTNKTRASVKRAPRSLETYVTRRFY